MRVLVACEYSGRVRDAFIREGHEAMSCDLLPTDVEGPHHQGDVSEVIGDGWDLMIAFPPCTYLCSSGLHWNRRRPQRAALTEQALGFVNALLDAPVHRIALENPVGCISTRIRKYDQAIQPWEYGDDASKKTCLWLKNLPHLISTKIVEPRLGCCKTKFDQGGVCKVCCGQMKAKRVWANQTPSGQNNLAPSADRWKIRSATFPGIAEAMAKQWGQLQG